MEAICKPDFDKRVAACKDAEKALEKAKKEGKSIGAILVPGIGFYDIYGVWFFGRLEETIQKICKERFGGNVGGRIHVFVDVDPKKIDDGIQDITAYGNKCILYKWTAQGYHRGLVVLADDEDGNKIAEVFRQSCTWSWMLNLNNGEK